MRQLLPALVVLGLAVTFIARPSEAGPPLPDAERSIPSLIEELSKRKKGPKTGLATARWYAGVFQGQLVSAPMKADAEVAAMASLRSAEGLILGRQCSPAKGRELDAASKVLAEFGEALPLTLRAYTLGSQGQGKDAANLLETHALGLAPGKSCPGEHPDASARRTRAVRFGLECVKQFDPKRDVTKLQETLDAAERCAAKNTSVG